MLVVFNFICSLESHRPRTVTKDLTIGLNYEKLDFLNYDVVLEGLMHH